MKKRNSSIADQISEFISKNPKGNYTYNELAKKFNTTENYVQTLLRRRGISPGRTGLSKIEKQSGPSLLSPVDLDLEIKRIITKQDHIRVDQIADLLKSTPNEIKSRVEKLIEVGYSFQLEHGVVKFQKTPPKPEPIKLDIEKMSTGFFKFGVCGDNHLGSKYERLDVLNALYDQYEKDGIKTVYNTGNWIEGESKFNKNDIAIHGVDNQIDYFLKNYPKKKGITTHFIAGDDHEGWYFQNSGLEIGKHAQRKAIEFHRNDLVYLGYMEADVILNGSTKLRVLHPGGGSAYATSYTVQKIVESYQGGEKPDILFVGHFHKTEYLYVRGVHCIQTGCTQDQSTWMRKKRLAAHLGGWEVEFSVDENGAITRFKTEFFPFYDNKYYQKWIHKS